MTQRHGLCPTARALGLDYTRRKKFVQSTKGQPKAAEVPELVELLASPAARISECTIELEGRQGRIRIQMRGVAPAALMGLSRRLWESAE